MASSSLQSLTVLTEDDDVPGSKFERDPQEYTVDQLKRWLRPVPNAAPLMCRTKLNTVRLWSDFGATADSDGVLASDLIREGHGKYFSMRKICDLNSLTLSK